jgi:hypothetical protein
MKYIILCGGISKRFNQYSFLKPLNYGGIMIFDDYEWNSDDKSTKKAVDKFLTEYSELIEILFINSQVGIKKIKLIKK